MVCRVVLACSDAIKNTSPALPLTVPVLLEGELETEFLTPRENQVTWGLGQGQQCKKTSLTSLVSGLKDEFLVPCVLPTLHERLPISIR